MSKLSYFSVHAAVQETPLYQRLSRVQRLFSRDALTSLCDGARDVISIVTSKLSNDVVPKLRRLATQVAEHKAINQSALADVSNDITFDVSSLAPSLKNVIIRYRLSTCYTYM